MQLDNPNQITIPNFNQRSIVTQPFIFQGVTGYNIHLKEQVETLMNSCLPRVQLLGSFHNPMGADDSLRTVAWSLTSQFTSVTGSLMLILSYCSGSDNQKKKKKCTLGKNIQWMVFKHREGQCLLFLNACERLTAEYYSGPYFFQRIPFVFHGSVREVLSLQRRINCYYQSG